MLLILFSMFKLVRRQVPSYVTHHFETMEHLPLTEQFETIQCQARLEALAKTSEHPL